MSSVSRMKTVRKEVREDLITELEEALAAARSGDVVGFVCIQLHADGDIVGSSFFERRLEMLGAIRMAEDHVRDR